MLFLSDAVLDTKDRLFTRLEAGNNDREAILQQILDLDPDDDFTLMLLAALRLDSSDRAGAEELLWRAVQAQPCSWSPYHRLSTLFNHQVPLSRGLLELTCRKLLRDEATFDQFEADPTPFEWNDLPELEGLSNTERFERFAAWLREQRDLEPVAVTARLRPHRLIDQLQQAESLDRPLVDALIQEGAPIVPLLVGVLRGWVQGIIPEDEISVVENTLALLGEIADVSAIPAVLELTTAKELDVAGASHWALHRIVFQHPDDAARVMAGIAPAADWQSRLTIGEYVIRHPSLDSSGTLLERLFEQLERVDKDSRNRCFPLLLSVVLTVRGRAGIDNARSLLRRHGELLSRSGRRTCEDIIDEYSMMRIETPAPAEPSPWTVYQICQGEVDWSEEMEENTEKEDDHHVEPLRRKATPGRNDPCWCASGKKYKKCHLEADEQQQT